MERDAEWVATPVREEQSGVVLRAIAGGLAAAVVGGAVWGLTVSATDYEIGFVAWAVGLLAGFAVVGASGGGRGLPFQLVAVACSGLGIVIGKYVTFAGLLEDFVRTEIDPAAAAGIGVFSADTFAVFREEYAAVFGVYDLL